MENPAGSERAWAQKLNAEIQEQNHGQLLPPHVVHRVAALLGGQDVEYADLKLSNDSQENLCGQLIVWTARHLAIVEMAGLRLANIDTARRNESGAVTVRVIPRSALREVVIPTRDGDIFAWEAFRDSWPKGAKLELRYDGLADLVSIPADLRHLPLGFVRSVLEDQLSAQRAH